MAAYAALASLMYTIEQIQRHPCPPISLHQNQVESLTEKVTFLQDFLEVYNYHVPNDSLDQSHIADVAHAAEDVIESHITNQILSPSNSTDGLFYEDLQKVTQDIDFIKREVMEIKEKMGSVHDHFHTRSSMPDAASSKLSPTITVGLDDVEIPLLDRLTSNPSGNRQIIPIIGTGGIGKTTLARNVYEHSLIVQYFDIRAWTTISQEYNAREILLQLLSSQGCQESSDHLKSEQELGLKLHKRLWSRRYLIVLDDMWSVEAWEKLKFSFPDNNNGSGIIITSRISSVALHLSGSPGHEMDFLDEDISWSLLCKIVFGKYECPPELEAIGKKIAKNCKGLPLSLVVIGGLLAKSNRTQECWKYIAENLNSTVNLENNAHCSNLLYVSYNHLPVYLKPCFLYFGVFREDCEIDVFDLINLWVAEGFLKPISDKSLEEAATEYLRELIDRNLILVSTRKSNGKIQSCKIHDLLRDLCMREAEKERFLCVTRQQSHNIFSQVLKTQRLVALHHDTSTQEFLTALQSASDVRSLISDFRGGLPLLNFKLLRVMKAFVENSAETTFFQLVNLRVVAISFWRQLPWSPRKVPSSFCFLWNLHTITFSDTIEIILDIWKMPQLRHVKISIVSLSKSSHSPMHGQGDFILENLQSLSNVKNFKCSEKMVKRIPNIKMLGTFYEGKRYARSYCCLNNLVLLKKLEQLSCSFGCAWDPMAVNRSELLHDLVFPPSLKELTLEGCCLHWEDISETIGSLPHLEVLTLEWNAAVGPEWETVEEHFCNLKYLEICCEDLECWNTDSTHFPHLEKLRLRFLTKLEKIPLSIGEIPTLQLIKIIDCSESVFVSAKEILEEQEEFGNEGLQVQAIRWPKSEVVESLASKNFSVHRWLDEASSAQETW